MLNPYIADRRHRICKITGNGAIGSFRNQEGADGSYGIRNSG